MKSTKAKVAKSNYTVSYKNNKKKGSKAQVVLKFKGNYSGTYALPYTILPKKTNITKLEGDYKGFTVRWEKRPKQASGYQVQYGTAKNYEKNSKIATIKSNQAKEKMVMDKPLLRIADQSIINMYLNEFIVRMDLKYNFYSVVHGVTLNTINKVFCKKSVFTKEEYDNAAKNPIIIHYFGHSFERPWFKHNAAYDKEKYLNVRFCTPWSEQPLSRWKKSESRVIRIYDLLSYCLLSLGFRDFCLMFRYICGQKIKNLTGIHR